MLRCTAQSHKAAGATGGAEGRTGGGAAAARALQAAWSVRKLPPPRPTQRCTQTWRPAGYAPPPPEAERHEATGACVRPVEGGHERRTR
eukprot:CAMPEP_0180011428 /NCGR_PEP_ID=MMETSP0984-20121128/16365_1 /TAXON_ID=483367 /ORGANISM="non described non described, Strain CCMP 2436" /LENGTH=88 /DNA_ID=CAMNT_0021933489 /DNA_START=123 /DNA_END=388 /DNA_ORIENTATION=-